jgi:adenosylhomocysteine nucleosidase
MSTILLLTALAVEAAPLRALGGPWHATTIHGIAVEQTAAAHPVALALTGIGKVNAALSAALLITALRPAAVLMLGVAGALAPGLQIGDVILARETAQYDYGRRYHDHDLALAPMNRSTTARHPERFPADPVWLARVARSAGIQLMVGTVISGDTLVIAVDARQALHTRFAALACDMESAAVAQVCAELAVPFLAVRAISDTDETAPLPLEQAVTIAATNAAAVVWAALR